MYQLTRITDRNNNTVTFTYAAGLLVKITDSNTVLLKSEDLTIP